MQTPPPTLSHFPSSLPPFLILSPHLKTSNRRSIQQRHVPRSSSSDEDLPEPKPSVPMPSSRSSNSSQSLSPWQMMARMVKESTVNVLNEDYINQGLIRSAAARQSNLEYEDFEARLADLLIVLPFLQDRLPRMRPALLAALAQDVSKIIQRIVELKQMLPGANIESILSQRPSLLLDEEYERIPAALESLQEHYDEAAIASMVTKEPLLLIEDLENILRELERFAPAREHIAALRANPELASQVSSLRNLSIW